MKNYVWFSHFKDLLPKEAPSHWAQMDEVSLLAELIKTSQIPEQNYFAWAKNHYELPVLNADYFSNLKSLEFWSSAQNLFAWSSYCLPVAQWDGHWIVACLQKPENFPEQLKPIFVLCSPVHMEKLWAQFHPNVAAATTTASTEMKLELLDDAPSEKENDVEGSDEDLIEVEEADQGAPTGLFELNNDTKPELTLITNQPEPEAAPLVATPEAPTSPQEAPLVFLTEAATPEVFVLPEDKTSIVESANVADSTQVIEAAQAQAPIPASAEEPKISFHDEHAGTSASKVKQAPAELILDILFQKNKAALDKEVRGILSKVRGHFHESLLLSLDIQENALKPYLWTSGIQEPVLTNSSVYLSEPSLFKIVNVSQKPYHGYVVVNETNEKFFAIWNGGSIPDHITATPLMINNKMAGILMAFGDKSHYTWAQLQFMEHVTSELNQKLSSLVESAA